MTTTAEMNTSKRGRGDEPTAAAPRPAAVGQPVKSRRRLWATSLGIVLVLISVLGVWYVVSNVSRTVTVLTTSASIDRGQEITQADLTTINIAGGQSTDAILANQAADVIGKVAAVDLPAGSLVTSANILDTLPVPAGDSIVGIALNQSQLPSYPLASGDKVRLVDTPVAQGEPPAEDPMTFDATVFTTKFDEKNQVWIVDLIVPNREAAAIAARAATQRVSIVLDSVGE